MSALAQALDIAKKSRVAVLTLHPHTTNKLQPLHIGVNSPGSLLLTRGYYATQRDPFQPYLKALTPINITNAFKKCVIFPFNRDFSEIDFLPSNVTDRPEPVLDETTPTNIDDDDATNCAIRGCSDTIKVSIPTHFDSTQIFFRYYLYKYS